MIYCPAWDKLAAQSPGVSEKLLPYYHWSSFAMGPALGFRAGGALGTEVFSQYGVGWPLVFTALDRVLPLSYTNMVGLAVCYGCLYWMAIYVFLRLAQVRSSWALAGTVLAAGTQLFCGLPDGAIMWTYPSSTMMRSPLDVWCFLALLMHARTSRGAWAASAFALAGLGIVFEIDTGIYLAAALLTYSILCLGGRPRRARGPWPVMATALACGASFLATLLPGLAVASRGTLGRADFWRGWAEGTVFFGNGMFALPVATEPGQPQILLFCACVCLLLFLVARALVPARDADRRNHDRFWAAWSAYGLAYLILFVYRSHSWNIYHAAPSVVVAAVYAAASAAQWVDRAVHRLGGQSWRRSLPVTAGCAALAFSLATVVGSPAFQNYPSLLGMALARSGFGDRGSESTAAVPAPNHHELPTRFEAVVAQMAALRSLGYTVGIIHPSEPMFYLHSECPILFRYPAFMLSSFTLDQLDRNLDRFTRAKLDYVLIINGNECEHAGYYLIWRAFRAVLGRHYAFQRTIGSFELWRRRGSGG
jgi:hypothetical protein